MATEVGPTNVRRFDATEIDPSIIVPIPDHLIKRLCDLMERLGLVMLNVEYTHQDATKGRYHRFDDMNKSQYNMMINEAIATGVGAIAGVPLFLPGSDVGRGLSTIASAGTQCAGQVFRATNTQRSRDYELVRNVLATDDPRALNSWDEQRKSVAQGIDGLMAETHRGDPKLSR